MITTGDHAQEIFLQNVTPDTLARSIDDIHERYDRYGVVVIKGFLSHDGLLDAYTSDLRALLARLEKRIGGGEPTLASRSLEEHIWGVFQKGEHYPRYVHDLGTHPMKLLSGNILKFRREFRDIAQTILGAGSIVASPTGSDNLLFFFPGEKFERYALPLHQDFPYLMQSATQLTMWIPLTPNSSEVGGFSAYLGSQRLGVCRNAASPSGLEIQIDESALAQFPHVTIEWELGDLVVLNSLLLHRSIPNTSADRLRAVQIFRFSNLLTDESEAYFWQSTNYTSGKGSVTFADVYPDLLSS